MSYQKSGVNRQKDRVLSSANDDVQAQSYGPVRVAPDGYDKSVWMLASLFHESAKYFGTSPGNGLPMTYENIKNVTKSDHGRSGWPYLVALTFSTYWDSHADHKPSGETYDQHWAEMYRELRDAFEDRVDVQALARLEAKRVRVREQIESGEIGIVRRMK